MGALRYYAAVSARILWCLPIVMLLGCSSAAVHNQRAVSLGGLPVDIEGNEELPLERLRQAIADGDMSSANVIATTVTGLYMDSGFIQARVRGSEDAERILIEIEEGERFTFGALQFKGKGRGSLPAPPFKQGDVFSSTQLRHYLETVRAFYASANHEVALRPLTVTRPETYSVDITVEIQAKNSDGPIHLEAQACVPTPNIGRGESLVLRGDQSVVLGAGRTYHFSKICVRDRASIHVCTRAEIRISRMGKVIVGGKGLGGFGGGAAEVTISSLTRNKMYFLFDTARGHIKATVASRLSPGLVYSVTGQFGLSLTSKSAGPSVKNRHKNDTSNFPTCN